MPLPDNLTLDALEVDINSLTLDELDTVEEITGRPFTDLGQRINAKALRALAFVTLRRTYPDLTMEEVGALRIALAAQDPTGPAAS